MSFVSQEQLSTMQTKLDEEESKNIKLQQHINKLEHHSAQVQEVRNQYSEGLCLSDIYHTEATVF